MFVFMFDSGAIFVFTDFFPGTISFTNWNLTFRTRLQTLGTDIKKVVVTFEHFFLNWNILNKGHCSIVFLHFYVADSRPGLLLVHPVRVSHQLRSCSPSHHVPQWEWLEQDIPGHLLLPLLADVRRTVLGRDRQWVLLSSRSLSLARKKNKQWLLRSKKSDEMANFRQDCQSLHEK